MEFTQEEYKLIFNAVRRYQMEKCVHDGKEYKSCDKILDSLFSLVYTQKLEQPT